MGFLNFLNGNNRNNTSLDDVNTNLYVGIGDGFDDYISLGELQSFTDNIINNISNDVSNTKFNHVITHEPDKNNYVKKEVLNTKNDMITRILNINGNNYTTAKGLLKDTVTKLLNTNYALLIKNESSETGELESLELADGVYDPTYTKRSNDGYYYYYQIKYDDTDQVPFSMFSIPQNNRGDLRKIRIEDAILFVNPRPVSDSTFNSLNSALSSSIDSMIKGLSKTKIQTFIKGTSNSIDSDAARNHLNSMKNKVATSVDGFSYLQAGQSIETVNRDLKSIAPEDYEAIKKLLYNSYGVNDDIINNSADEVTMNNYYQKVVGSILTYMVQELNKKLFTSQEINNGHEIVYKFNTFKYASLQAQTNFIDKMIYNGVFSQNEARELLNMEPYEDGDSRQTNANAIPMQLMAQPSNNDNNKNEEK